MSLAYGKYEEDNMNNEVTQCEHQLMRNGGNTYWVCIKCEHVFHGGGEKDEEGLTKG